MRKIRHELIDWEPFHICIVFREAVPGAAVRVQKIVEEAVIEGAAARQCWCGRKHLYVGDEPGSNRVTITIQWLCDECLDEILSRVEASFPNSVQAELGLPCVEAEPQARRMVRVAAKAVELEGGRIEEVAAFVIAKFPVTVAEMEAFCDATEYITTAERLDPHTTFRTHPGSMGLPKRSWGNSSVHQVSWLDADAYCRWVGARLPSEFEWAVANSIGEQRYDPKTDRDLLFNHATGRAPLRRHPDALEGGGVEWTGTTEPGERAVIRSRRRTLKPLDYFDPVTTFRICHTLPAEGNPRDQE